MVCFHLYFCVVYDNFRSVEISKSFYFSGYLLLTLQEFAIFALRKQELFRTNAYIVLEKYRAKI